VLSLGSIYVKHVVMTLFLSEPSTISIMIHNCIIMTDIWQFVIVIYDVILTLTLSSKIEK